MKRDWDVIREILVRLEASATPHTVLDMNAFDKQDPQNVAYNMRILDEDGLIEARINSSSQGNGLIDMAQALRLTPRGHDLLDSIRNETVWKKTISIFKSKGLEMTTDLVISVGKMVMKLSLIHI